MKKLRVTKKKKSVKVRGVDLCAPLTPAERAECDAANAPDVYDPTEPWPRVVVDAVGCDPRTLFDKNGNWIERGIPTNRREAYYLWLKGVLEHVLIQIPDSNLATLLKSYVSPSVYSRFKPKKGRKHAS
jgi:hypothetical protein